MKVPTALLFVLLGAGCRSGAPDPSGETKPVETATAQPVEPARVEPQPAEPPRVEPTNPSALPDRYQRTPMLVILEAYALSVIGQLSPEREKSAAAIVKKSFGGGDDWRATFRSKMKWPKDIDDNITLNWKNYQTMAQGVGAKVDPRDFARTFADEVTKDRGPHEH